MEKGGTTNTTSRFDININNDNDDDDNCQQNSLFKCLHTFEITVDESN